MIFGFDMSQDPSTGYVFLQGLQWSPGEPVCSKRSFCCCWCRSENFRRSNNISTFFNFFKSWEAAAIQKFKSSKVEIHGLQKVQKLKNYKYNIWKRSKVQKVQMLKLQHWKSWKSWKSSKVDFLFPEKFKSSKVEIRSSEKLKKLKSWMSKWLGEGECVACCATAFFADGCGWRLRGGPFRGRPETFSRSRGALIISLLWLLEGFASLGCGHVFWALRVLV